ISDGAPQATSTHSIPRRTLPGAWSSVLTCWVVTVRAISSKCSSSRCTNLNIVRARWTTGVSRQAGKALAAARTAASRSARVESGVFAMTEPTAGLWTSTNPPARGGVPRPPMKIWGGFPPAPRGGGGGGGGGGEGRGGGEGGRVERGGGRGGGLREEGAEGGFGDAQEPPRGGGDPAPADEILESFHAGSARGLGGRRSLVTHK